MSENGGDPKKQCEETTTVNDDFKKGLQNPDCLAILLMCLHENLMIKRKKGKKKSRLSKICNSAR